MKRQILTIFSFLFILHFVSGISKVAVLDASLGTGVDINAAAIVADTLNEQFVKSPAYIAIDRAYISSIQQEKKFQLSGDVNQTDIKQMGVTFGAEFICIANVSLLGSTYTVSARLIEVETAQVVSQESARKQGQIDVLFDVAEEVGSKLIGMDFINSTTSQSQKEISHEEESAAVKRTPEKPRGKRPHFTVGYMFAGFMGDDGNDTNSGDSYYSFYEMDQMAIDAGAPEANLTTWGIDLHLLIPLKYIYLSLGASYTDQNLWAGDSSLAMSYEIFSTVNPSIGIGGIYSFNEKLQVYGGLNLGYLLFILGSDYGDDATESIWGSDAGETAGGMAIGIELGADYFFNSLCLSARYKLSFSGDLTGDKVFTDDYQNNSGGDTSFGVDGLVLGVGYTW